MKYIITILLIVMKFCFAVPLARAPKVEPKPIIGNYDTSLKPLPPPQTGYDQNIIHSIPDFRSTAGSPGKNLVFADDGQNVAVIFGRFSGDPTNIFQVMVAYSTDRGNTWTNYGPLSTFDARRVYSGLDARQDWPASDLMIHFAWHQAAQSGGNYLASPTFYSKEVSYPDGLITAAYELPNSEDWDVWDPCIAVKDSFVIITVINNTWFKDSYIWRSTDYGETWDNGRLFFPGPLYWMGGPHFRFGSDGYIFFLWNRQTENYPDLYWPYYCESYDYGLTWTEPQLIWQDRPPYPDMSNVTGWWYDYDCEVVNDTPVATVKLATRDNDYGEIWAYRPDSGGPGNWRFRGTKLVGGDSTAPQPFARYPTIAADDTGNTIIGYQALFLIQNDTLWDCGTFVRFYHWNRWFDCGRITFNGNDIEEGCLEFAHNALADPWWGIPKIGMIYNDAGEYPNTGNLYFDYRPVIDIPETQRRLLKQYGVLVSPNPFHNSVKFVLTPHICKARLSVFDVTGKLVRELTTNNQQPKTEFIWDGRKADGSLANSGVYFYNISSSGNQYQGKVILMR
ncbi:MAG: T9SS type A sorting domain-containing protein [candidate division WOR-3 bacterium]|nr:T9SS type A sorting domain-containing protein [candidate division WOR-3 bacterium]